MAVLHIAGVLVEGVVARAPLIRAMITGWKPVPPGLPVPDPRSARPVAAALALALVAAPTTIALVLLSRLPPTGVPVMPTDTLFVQECGACHRPFHPSLLPRASWGALMTRLDDHFGEDASLPADEARQIGAYLQTYAAEAWDTEAARRFAVVSPGQPLRITQTPYWLRKHAGLAPTIFARPEIGARSNCGACHRDSESGRFDDQSINIPEGKTQ
jgi:hypothetical protein